MNFMIWNSRGTGSKAFPGLIRDLKNRFKLDFLALVETRQSGNSADEIGKKFGFDRHERVEATGYAGGIWCFWRNDKLVVQVVGKHNQFIHLRMQADGMTWLFTIVYGSPIPSQRRILWEKLKELSENVDLPWAIAGDFNAFLFDFEKHGGSRNGSRLDQGFIEWFENSNLVDLGFSGECHTWRRGEVAIRLDRVVATQSWRVLFPEASVVHLSKFKSDHNPLWIRFDPTALTPRQHDRPFRVLAAWLTHEGFSDVVKKAWDAGNN